MAHVEGQGDTHWHGGGHFCGTRGQSRRIEGIAIRLTGHLAPYYSVTYSAHLEGIGDTPHHHNGQFVGTRGQSKRLEGFVVTITPNA